MPPTSGAYPPLWVVCRTILLDARRRAEAVTPCKGYSQTHHAGAHTVRLPPPKKEERSPPYARHRRHLNPTGHAPQH